MYSCGRTPVCATLYIAVAELLYVQLFLAVAELLYLQLCI